VTNSHSKKILVVDDSETNRLLLRFTLEELGYTVEEVNDGEKAVEAALEYDYAAVFMDINMPVMSGIEATEILVNLNYDSPIIACSAEDNLEAIATILTKGFSAFVPKPLEPKDIITSLDKFKITCEAQNSNFNQAHQDKLDQLSGRFIDNLPVIINKLESALKNDSFEELKRISHKLKGSASQFGFDRITRISRDIESAINKDKLSIATEKANFLLFELNRLKNESQQQS